MDDDINQLENLYKRSPKSMSGMKETEELRIPSWRGGLAYIQGSKNGSTQGSGKINVVVGFCARHPRFAFRKDLPKNGQLKLSVTCSLLIDCCLSVQDPYRKKLPH